MSPEELGKFLKLAGRDQNATFNPPPKTTALTSSFFTAFALAFASP